METQGYLHIAEALKASQAQTTNLINLVMNLDKKMSRLEVELTDLKLHHSPILIANNEARKALANAHGGSSDEIVDGDFKWIFGEYPVPDVMKSLTDPTYYMVSKTDVAKYQLPVRLRYVFLNLLSCVFTIYIFVSERFLQ